MSIRGGGLAPLGLGGFLGFVRIHVGGVQLGLLVLELLHTQHQGPSSCRDRPEAWFIDNHGHWGCLHNQDGRTQR